MPATARFGEVFGLAGLVGMYLSYHLDISSGATIVLDRRRNGTVLVSHTYNVRPDGKGWRVIEPYR